MITLVESHYTMFDFLPVNRNLDAGVDDLDEKKWRAGPPFCRPQATSSDPSNQEVCVATTAFFFARFSAALPAVASQQQAKAKRNCLVMT